ncbi:MAG TPA: methionyl-tRNA formyltransferase [bacterium]|nr:methionyl-tRNA formyltransferase [bacterium]HOL54713.1 methionyl-tRNA formyltransferase [bacterium]HON72130.1 methionyl-tRNA formyltransferase [bacterium]HOP55613.1 methionyl-tRNA formyltransferase [bacterium]HPO81766.1 methionyl-tRNA formyltransferase [bacterium]
MPSLEYLRDRISLVITRPDRPQGRGLKVLSTPVKSKAIELRIPVLSPERLIDIKDKLTGFDLGVVVAYGLIIPRKIINLFPMGIINLHPSLLPKYRGAAPIQWALLNGEEETGVSIIYLTEELDAGDIIIQEKVKILPEDNAETLSSRLSVIGANVLAKAVELIENNKVRPVPQNSLGIPSYAPKIEPQMGRIDWNTGARDIVNKVRALSLWPGAYFYSKGIKVNMLEAEVSPINGEAGKVIDIGDNGILVGSRDGSVWIKKIRPENRKIMSGLDFANGYRIKIGDPISDG